MLRQAHSIRRQKTQVELDRGLGRAGKRWGLRLTVRVFRRARRGVLQPGFVHSPLAGREDEHLTALIQSLPGRLKADNSGSSVIVWSGRTFPKPPGPEAAVMLQSQAPLPFRASQTAPVAPLSQKEMTAKIRALERAGISFLNLGLSL